MRCLYQKINIGSYKSDKSILNTFEIIITSFQILNKLKKVRYFQKIFLVANINIKIVFEIFFFIFSNININFTQKKLIWKIYSITKVLFIIKKILIIN